MEGGDEVLQEQLDDEQLEVAAVTDANVLVLAPPGSGKTRVLVNAAAHRVRHARNLVGYDSARAMCLTFGTDAAHEMRQRLEERPLSVPGQRLWVGNYHSLGAYLLRRYGHLLNWPRDAGLLPTPSNEPVLSEAITELGIRGLKAKDASAAISALKGRRSVDDEHGTLHRLRERYDEILRERRLRDFDDLILHAIDLLEHFPGVCAIVHDAYPFLFVDELQDTNLLQLDLLGHLVGKSTRVFAVADDDQRIYGWRDAYPENLDEFVERFAATEYSLVGNYRCPPNVVSAANALIALNDRRRDVLMESRVDDRAGEVIVITAVDRDEAEVVVDEVERSHADGVPLGQIAILAPHHFKFDEVVTALDRRGLRFVHAARGQLAAVSIIRLIQLVLRCVAGGSIVDEDAAALGSGDPSALCDAIKRSAEEAAMKSPRGLLNRIMGEFDLGTTQQPNQEQDAIRILARMTRKALDDSSPSTSAELAEVMVFHWDRLERAALRAEDAVKVMTSFGAKGTEYCVVILPFLSDGLVPYAPKGKTIDWEEARRLFYVALTRSEDRVVLIRDGGCAPSELLLAVEATATETYRV